MSDESNTRVHGPDPSSDTADGSSPLGGLLALQQEDAPLAFCTTCGQRLEDGECPDHPSPDRTAARSRIRPRVRLILEVSAFLLLAILLFVSTARLQRLDDRFDSQSARIEELNRKVTSSEADTAALSAQVQELLQPEDPPVDSKRLLASVFTVAAGRSRGSSFVISVSERGSLLVTSYHVVSELWRSGRRDVQLLRGDQTYEAVIDAVSVSRDLALISADQAFTPLPIRKQRLPIGHSVLALGSPVGLDGTVSSGIVSAHRDGYVQFTAPVSPGNSGGPLTDSDGRAVGVVSLKIVGEGAEGLSFAIPISEVCNAFDVC